MQLGRVIGRVVAFRDPVLAKAAWARGDKDWVVQDTAGAALGAYGGFTNFANANVVAYNLAIADEAARAGVDEHQHGARARVDGPHAQKAVAPSPFITRSTAMTTAPAACFAALKLCGLSAVSGSM